MDFRCAVTRRTRALAIVSGHSSVGPDCQVNNISSPPRYRAAEIHRTIDELNKRPLSQVSGGNSYARTTRQVVNVLQSWAVDDAILHNWRSIVNKANLRREVEESIVALHHLQEWQMAASAKASQPYVAVDACCGKGIFSLLLSFLAPRYYPNLQRIILFDKDPNIDWTHIHEANRDCGTAHGRPCMELWAGANLHDHDEMVTKLASYQVPVALTGIHLCKTLSPSLVGIANALKAPYLCVAPCCLPRPNQILSIRQYETPLQLEARRKTSALRAKARERRRASCYVCQGEHHVRNCPQKDQYASPNEWNQVVEKALLRLPCWKCGHTGHSAKYCSTQHALLARNKPRNTLLSMTTIATGPKPFEEYCRQLSTCIESCSSLRVVDAGLTSTGSTSSSQKQHQNNWNKDRKALFIIASS